MSTPTMSIRGDKAAARLPGALLRYRVMALITGVFLLLLTIEMILKYLIVGHSVLGSWIAIVHGWIYVVYLVTVVDLWSTLTASPRRLVGLVAAGVVPVMSFIAERRVTREVHELLQAYRIR